MENECVEADHDLRRQILDFSKHLAGSAQVTAISLFDYCTTGETRAKTAMEAVVVVHDFAPRMMSYVRVIAGRTIVMIVVDQWVFERDVERGFLGEASAGTLVFPYIALCGEAYLHAQEILLKKRLILELLENLALGFPEFADRLRIKPEYFMYEVLLNRVRVFPPLAECVSNFMRKAEHTKRHNSTLDGYLEALTYLQNEMKVNVATDYLMIPKKIISDSKKPRTWLTNISRNAPRTLFTPIFEVFPQLLNLFTQNAEGFPRFQTLAQWRQNLDTTRAFVDPQKYVFVPTSEGLVSLADRIDIDAFVKEKLLHGRSGRIRLDRVGGVLNDVYLIKTESHGEERKVIVKRFKDWSGFKWFPLNLWSLGTRQFAVLGKSRLERECNMSEFLRNEGFNVAKVLHVSHGERLVFMDFVEGENLAVAIKRLATSTSNETIAKDLEKLSRVGGILAKVHALRVVLGDTKPENVIVDSEGEIYLLDLEQASQGGDKSWDIAEFLYYAGHYLPPLHSNEKAEAIAKAFISGYVKAGGDVNDVKKAGASKYTRVFSLFTTLSVLVTMSAACRKTEPSR